MDYKGKFSLVTGASKGLGRSFAEELASRGSHLVLVARSKDELETLAAALRRNHNIRAEIIQADLSERSAPSRIVESLENMGIQIDLLVNNAAVGYSGRFFSRPLEEHSTSVIVNAHSLVSLTHCLGNKMIARGSGGIINVGSNGAFQPVPYSATYTATKAFVLLFSEAVAQELRGAGVRMMVANPGPTATEFFKQSPTTVALETMDSAHSVARRTLDDYAKGKIVSYPGRFSTRAATWISRFMPRELTAALAGQISRKMGFDR